MGRIFFLYHTVHTLALGVHQFIPSKIKQGLLSHLDTAFLRQHQGNPTEQRTTATSRRNRCQKPDYRIWLRERKIKEKQCKTFHMEMRPVCACGGKNFEKKGLCEKTKGNLYNTFGTTTRHLSNERCVHCARLLPLSRRFCLVTKITKQLTQYDKKNPKN